MTVTTRRAGPLDARPMAELLNEIIEVGGTTAMTEPVSREDLMRWMEADPRSIWHVAEDPAGEILGFQTSPPGELLPVARLVDHRIEHGDPHTVLSPFER